MWRICTIAFIAGIFFSSPSALGSDCQDAIDEYNQAADEDEAWFEESLQSEFGVSRWSEIDWSEPRACERILPIYQEQLSRAEHVRSLHEAAAGVCRNLRFSGSGRPPQERIEIIRENIRLCEETVSDQDSSEEASGGEGEEEFKAVQQLAEEQQRQAAQQITPPSSSAGGYGRSANCSDITGTGGGGGVADCPEPQKREFSVLPQDNKIRAPATTTPSPSVNPQPGIVDRLTGLAGSIVDALGRVRSGQEDSKPRSSTGASLPEDFDPKTFDTYRNDPPELPKEGVLCRQYFLQMLQAFHQNARLCIRDTRLLQSIEQMVEKRIEAITEEDKLVTRKTPPELYAYFAEKDPRWQDMGDYFEPRCDIPMTVASQEEAFKECARVYLCGARAAECGLKKSRGTKTKDCRPISHACLAENPIPQYMRGNPSPPPYQQPNWQQAQPKGSPSTKSTITGPSGPSGTGGSGGVIPAR